MSFDTRKSRSSTPWMRLVALLVTVAAPLAVAATGTAVGGSTPPTPAPTSSLAGDLAAARVTVAVRLALLEKLGRDGLRIHIDVRGDKVTLTGSVAARASQELAEEVALSVKGVRSVDNRLQLLDSVQAEPHPVEKAVGKAENEVDDAVLESRVKLRLLDQMGLVAFNVEVEAVDGIVSLRGTLPDEDHRDIALRTTNHAKGVKKVVDLLRVR